MPRMPNFVMPSPFFSTSFTFLMPLRSGTTAPGFRYCVVMPAGNSCCCQPDRVTVLNSPGLIDSDYRGELMVALVNLGAEPFRITRGMRIAQMVVARVERVAFVPVDALPPTTRGTGGFGSSGR